MSFPVTTLKELARAGANLKLQTSVPIMTLKELVQIALTSGSKIEIGFSIPVTTAKEVASMAPNQVTFNH